MAHAKVTKNGTQTTGTANTFSYSGNFDVFKGEEVVVSLDAVNLTRVTTTINESASPREYTVDNTAKTIHIGGADLGSGNSIIIRPQTDMGEPTPRATYSPGASITSADLNNNQLQLMRKAMEYDDTKMSTTGDTMTGDLIFDPSVGIKFKEAAANGTNTATLKGPASTADVTITLPSVTGTVVTTGDSLTVSSGMIAADAITAAKIGDNQIDSEHYAADSIDTEHYAPNSVDTAALANDAVTGAQIADDAIDSEHIVADSIDAEHYAPNSVNADALAHTSVSAGSYTAADITVDAQGRITAASSGNISSGELAGDVIDGSKLADEAVDSEHYVDGSIDSAHIGADQVITSKIADSNITLGKLHGDLKQTSISDSDTQLPTSGAVVDYVSTQLATVGGFETIATDAAFPNSQPASGIIVSIADAGGLVVNGSDTSTTGRTVGGSTVTINSINSQFRSTTVAAGVAMMVESTGSSHTYTYHKATLKEADLINLSSDIQDFGNRYRTDTNRTANDSDTNHDGDLFFDQTANKMYVYDGAYDSGGSWGQVTSTGEFKILGIKDNGQAHNGSGPTFNGSNDQFDLFEGTSDASITQCAQLIVSLNGVIQKPNDGSFDASGEGFYLDGTDGIRFCDPPASGSVCFVVKCGSGVSVPTPADNSVTAAKTDISIVQGDVIYGNGTDSWTRLAKGTAGQVLKMNSGATAPEWGTDANDNTQLSTEQVQDIAGPLIATGGTKTGITITYQDADGDMDFVVNDTTKLPLAGGTMTGVATFNAAAIGEVTTISSSSNATALNLALSNNFKITLGENSTISQPSNQVAGQSGSIFVTQDGTGSRTLAYHADFKWAGGTAPTLTTTAAAVDRIDYVVAAANKIHAVASLDVK